jgi:peroxiredoxin
MAATESTMLALGTAMPKFSLPDFDGKSVTSTQFDAAPGLVVAFICNHCPFVRHLRREFARFARDFQARGIAVVAIASNDAQAYPQDGPDGMRSEAQEVGYTFPYLFDATQAVAKSFQAACTPDFYLFDGAQRLCYRGQFDDSRPGNKHSVTGKDLRAACDALLSGKPVLADQRPSIGCNIKWKAGN